MGIGLGSLGRIASEYPRSLIVKLIKELSIHGSAALVWTRER